MKKTAFVLALLSALPVAFADTGMMGDYGMMGTGFGGMFGYGLLWLVYFALAAFIFSVIFWWTHNWLAKKR